ncbi:homeobox protein 3 [Anabrus simplex]|uniref:homeobox protein 3 n=1 Tax=Anabrus simplex TaxID=316456 RepID=UPI0035A2969A
MTNLQYSITMMPVLALLLLCVPTSPLPTSTISADGIENDATSPRIPEMQAHLSQEEKSKSETGLNNPYQEILYTSNPPSFNNFYPQYGNPLSRENPLLSGDQNRLLYSNPYSSNQPHFPILYRTESSLTLPKTNALEQQNVRLIKRNQRILSLRRGRYRYPVQNIYPNQFPYYNIPARNFILPPSLNNDQSYPQYSNTNLNPGEILVYPNQNPFIPQYSKNEQSQTSSSQNRQHEIPQQNTNNAPSQNQEDHNSDANKNSVQNQPGNQNVPQQPNVNENGSQNHTGNQNQSDYPSSDMQNGGGQNMYPNGMYPNQYINQTPDGIPIQYAGLGYYVPVIYQNPFPFGYQTRNQNVQYRPIST